MAVGTSTVPTSTGDGLQATSSILHLPKIRLSQQQLSKLLVAHLRELNAPCRPVQPLYR